jgi:hypothetical protein
MKGDLPSVEALTSSLKSDRELLLQFRILRSLIGMSTQIVSEGEVFPFLFAAAFNHVDVVFSRSG